MSWPWSPGQRSLNVIGADTDRSATYDFLILLMFHGKHGPISYRFWDKWWFQSKIANFSHPVYFIALLNGFSLEFGIGAWCQRNYSDGDTWPNKKSDDIFSRVDTIHQRDRRTDTGRTPDDSKDRDYAQRRAGNDISVHGCDCPFIMRPSSLGGAA